LRHFFGQRSAKYRASVSVAASVEDEERRGERLFKGAGGFGGRRQGGRGNAKGESERREQVGMRFYLYVSR
jgi:hypothetical protein